MLSVNFIKCSFMHLFLKGLMSRVVLLAGHAAVHAKFWQCTLKHMLQHMLQVLMDYGRIHFY